MATLDRRPKHVHDCSACTYLGEYEGSDLYHCAVHSHPTLLARFSSKPDGYQALQARHLPMWGPFTEAYSRAMQMRLPLG